MILPDSVVKIIWMISGPHSQCTGNESSFMMR